MRLAPQLTSPSTSTMSAITALHSDPLIGVVLADRYRILRLIGQGGMGVVYEAEHIALGKRVAIKLLLAGLAHDPEAVARFQREALTASQIGNPHIVDVLDVGTAPDGRSYFVLEYLQGADLHNILQAQGPMDGMRAIHIMRQVLHGVAAAHQRGIVHRDLKPENVFIIERGEEPDFVKLLDFGISKIIDAAESNVRLTVTGSVLGTPLYMAPEQARGEPLDHRADIYALGVMFYEMLTGHPPFSGPNYATLVAKQLYEAAPSLAAARPDLPAWLVAVVHRALEKHPQQRFATATEFLQALPSRSLSDSNKWQPPSWAQGAGPQQTMPAMPGSTMPGHSLAFAAPPAPTTLRVYQSRKLLPWLGLTGAVVVAVVITLLVTNSGKTTTVATPPPSATTANTPPQSGAATANAATAGTATAGARPSNATATPSAPTPRPSPVADTIAAAPPQTLGTLIITLTPPADFTLDGGQQLLRAPQSLELPAGMHRVVLINPINASRETVTVKIVAGELTRITRDYARKKVAPSAKPAHVRDGTINPFE